MRRISLVFLALLLLLSANVDAAARRRAVRPPTNPDAFISQDPSTVPGWLLLHGHTLSTPEYFSTGRAELEPLRTMIGDAEVVGLGDGTHGTHEFSAVKLRIIDFLVREMDFDTLILEAPVSHFARLNDYILGGDVDARAVLAETLAKPDLAYTFWNNAETLAVLDWMRAYNAGRGTRPPLLLFGGDVFGQNYAWQDVVAYLRTVDAALATMAESEYACIGTRTLTGICRDQATRVRDALLAAEADLIARSSRDAFYAALYEATVILNGQDGFGGRDEGMADNVTWLRDNFSTTKRVIYWAHNGHVSRNRMNLSVGKTTGEFLVERYGDDYFVIGTMTGAGSYHSWNNIRGQLVRQVVTFNPVGPNSHEAYLGQRGTLPFILPLRGELPEWLTAARELNAAPAGGSGAGGTEVLPESFDAIVYIPLTTPFNLFP